MNAPRFSGIVRFVHVRGAAPCGRQAFIGPPDILNGDKVVAVSNGAIAVRLGRVAAVACEGCNHEVTRDDLETRDYSSRQVFVAPDRRRSGRPRLTLESGKPLTLGQLSAIVGIHRDKLKRLAEGGELPGAYRDRGIRREWRVGILDARAFVQSAGGLR
jgi:hypothetical protein